MSDVPPDLTIGRPTILEPDEIHEHLRTLLSGDRDRGYVPELLAERLLDLVFGLSDTYAKLEPELGRQLFQWVRDHWRDEPPAYVDCLCSLLAHFEPGEARDFIEERLAQTRDPDVRRLLKETLGELGPWP